MPRQSRNRLVEYYGCPAEAACFAAPEDLPPDQGFFRLGGDTVGYGRCLSGTVQHLNGTCPPDVLPHFQFRDGVACLPFDLDEIIDNLRLERYAVDGKVRHGKSADPVLRKIYYVARPLLSDSIRGQIKRFILRGWEKIKFPRWPVDTSVEDILKHALRLTLDKGPGGKIPFIWFWPEGAAGCFIMTHDVETTRGRDACAGMMDIDDSFGMKSSFQVVPEERYEVDRAFLNSIVERGFEVNVQDLNHDGHLFDNYEQFQQRAVMINRYAAEYGAAGFRAGVLYRNLDWLGSLDIAYDMSVPNVAHLDPQRGGCCTVMPYFIGDILEVPLTTTQDYMLFDILRQSSLDLWKAETETILANNGLASFLVHPDYLRTPSEMRLYEELLGYLQSMASERNVWTALPIEVSQWWRQRSEMSLVREGNRWKVQGPGSERACVAYARLQGNEVVYEIEPQAHEQVRTACSTSSASR